MMLRGEFTNTTKDVVRGMARAKLFPVKKMGELLSLGSPGTHEKEWASGSIVYHIGKGINVHLSEMAPRQIYVRISSRTFWSRKIDNCDLIVPYGVNFVSASLHCGSSESQISVSYPRALSAPLNKTISGSHFSPIRTARLRALLKSMYLADCSRMGLRDGGWHKGFRAGTLSESAGARRAEPESCARIINRQKVKGDG